MPVGYINCHSPVAPTLDFAVGLSADSTMARYFNSNGILKIIIFPFSGCLCGIWTYKLYGYTNGWLIRGYDLSINSAIILYRLAGLIYSVFDYFLRRIGLDL